MPLTRLFCGLLIGLLPLTNAFAQETPALQTRVDNAGLRPIAQRLPAKPEVIVTLADAQYGGTLRSGLLADGDQNGILRFVAQGLLRWDAKFERVIPNIAESWQSNADATLFTFRLRAGMRWSDGTPFTADDIVFAINDVLGNRDVFRTLPDRYQAGGERMRAEKLDAQTVRIHFAAGARSFPEELAGPYGHHPVLYPKHYCGQFHADINPQAAELATQAGLANWPALLRQRCSDYETRWSNPDKPTLDPWVITQPYVFPPNKDKTAPVLLTRNPYYWQVDTAGRQLPYIDTLHFDLFSSPQALIDAAATGRFDLQIRGMTGVQATRQLTPLIASGSHAWLRLPDVNASAVGLYLNHSTLNLPLRLRFASRQFKAALSQAINRQAIADKLFDGKVQPWQVGPPEGHRLYNATLAHQFSNYDPASANRLLDELGGTYHDEAGYRLLRNQRLRLRAIVNMQPPVMVEALKLIQADWAAIGVELQIDAVERTQNFERAFRNDYDISVDVASGGIDPTQNPRAYLAIHPSDSRQSLPWTRWYNSQGKQGEEPSTAMQARYALWDRWKAAPDEATADALFRDILAIAAEEFEVIGTVTSPAQTGIRSARLRGVPDSMPGAWIWPTPGPSLPQQYFLKP
ncbi:ABC transporter substrate-binding protein [Viridibacterium curvum]|uniref:ABC transporter substrate-binding protein n=1 Tax=Viridibacterium curvum TaxID=1101404 RepID=A0ABP9QIA6_9RHOO